MSTSNFDFFAPQWPDIAAEARRAEHHVVADPRAALFYARRTAELAVTWMYQADGALRRPYKDDLMAMLDEASFKRAVGEDVHAKLHLIRMRGNAAVHKPVTFTPNEAVKIVRELWFVLVWIATVYAHDPANRPAAGVAFDPDLVPRPQPGLVAKTRKELAEAQAANEAKDAALAALEAANTALEAELAALRAGTEVAKARNEAEPIAHELDEASTRLAYIDALLEEAGWEPDGDDVAEYPVTFADGAAGRVDYVLWGDDGRPLAVVEAKRTRVDARAGTDQARRYADALENRFGRRPVVYTSNGYETWMQDDGPARPVHGFRTRAELEWLVQQRTARKPLATLPIDERIAGRDYQQAAIRAITETFEVDRQRRALVVMATGSGKTRTVVALVKLLQQAGWVKRVLFLADRRALVRQAKRAFAEHLPDTTSVNLLEDAAGEGRVVVSTYQTMLGLISGGADDAARRFGPGAFDLVIVDEAHRSVYRKYGVIFDYFDALLVGLTATPKDEVDHNTYRLFRLEDGVPTFSYDLANAIADGYLVPPAARVITSEFLDRGIRYEERSEAEREEWDLTDWGEDGEIPDEVGAEAFNRWLFNEDTIDEILRVLMTEGRMVDGGDRLGKTIVFARNEAHARFIAERFDANYPEHGGRFAQVITYGERYADRLIEEFADPGSAMRIAVSVDMLDTGIDVPEVVNLVFAKLVRSKTKYWQMLGRGTRLRSDLYGPGEHKRDFAVFDVGGNVEFFNQDLPALERSGGASLHERLFRARLDVIAAIDGREAALDVATDEVRQAHVEYLHGVVAGMHPGNVLVRPHRRALERFAEAGAWQSRTGELADAEELADLPSAALAHDTDESAKRFDVLVLRAELAVAGGARVPDGIRDRVRVLAEAMSQQRAIPLVAEQADLIEAVAGVDWWDDVTLPLLELARTRLRGLVRLVPSDRRAPVYTDFADVVGVGDAEVVIAQPGVDRERFRAKLYGFLRAHESHVVLRKLRTGRQLTETDIAELQRMLDESGEFDAEELAGLAAEAERAHGLGSLIRSIVGLDRAAARSVLEEHLAASLPLNSKQLAFVDLVVSNLTANGAVDPGLLYEPPFSEVAAQGPEELFGDEGADALVAALRMLDEAAEPIAG